MTHVDTQSVAGIRFIYLPKGTNTDIAITEPADIFDYKEILRDAVITDLKTLSTYCHFVNEWKISKDQHNYDARVLAILRFKDGRDSMEFMFGEFQNIVHKGQLMEPETGIFEFLDSLLYDNETPVRRHLQCRR